MQAAQQAPCSADYTAMTASCCTVQASCRTMQCRHLCRWIVPLQVLPHGRLVPSMFLLLFRFCSKLS